MRQQYGGNVPQGLKIVTVSMFNNPGRLRAKLQELEVTFPALYDGKKLAAEYGVFGVPGLILLDAQGQPVYGSSELDMLELEAAIGNCLGR